MTPNLLNISGPESIVSRISRVSAAINVDGVSNDVSDNVIPVLYDEDNQPITSDLLEMNQSAVTIRAKILGTKSVPVRCQVPGSKSVTSMEALIFPASSVSICSFNALTETGKELPLKVSS